MSTSTNALQPHYRAAYFIVRWILGILFVVAGHWKVFELGVGQHAQQFFVAGYADSWIPAWLLLVLGTVIPYWELAAGILLLAGYRLREVLTSLGVLLMITTYGHALKEPLFDITGHTFSRLALIVFLLLLCQHKDRWSVDGWLERRRHD
jgi:uncharacterized membrane protein YphA (DoxX/SURF4 family)